MKLFVALFAIIAVVAAGEAPSSEYLPPVEAATVAVGQVAYAPQESAAVQQVAFAPQESAALADDGYRYKTVRRLRYRHRRDVSELPSGEYLPPAGAASAAVEHVAYAPQESAAVQQVAFAPQESAALADDGYRYKTVRRLRYRHRRDVSELPSSEYLPPAGAASAAVEQVAYAPQESASVQQVAFAPQESAALADDGYRYKSVRRLRYRHRRDVSELPSGEYLPPAGAASVAVEQVAYAPQESASVQQVSFAPQESAALADDGYRYKTVRRLRYRHRRDVSELPSGEYLPPAGAASAAVEQVAYAPQESAAVQQVAFAPQESASVAQAYLAPQESAVLANDGYRYKTVRRLRYRHRRDVSELPSGEYLPPAGAASAAVEQVAYAPQESAAVQQVAFAPQESASVAQAYLAPQESAVLANDGYRYKTVRRLRYRHRRDVSELPSGEYLPPAGAASAAVEQVAYAPQESAAVQQVAFAPQESAALADDGYRYKTVRRLRYRHRRDVNELPSSEYLPPAGAASAAVEQVAYAPQESASVQQVAFAPQESAALADDGYRYKTVRRLRYRHRRDVNELPSSEYLPPAGAASAAVEQVAYAPQESAAVGQAYLAPQESAVLANDGYRYKAVRRLRYRQRRV